MNHIKKIIYFIATSSFTLVVLLTLVLFFYAAFFFEPPSVKKKIEMPSHIQSKKNPSKKIEKIETPKIKEVIKNSLFATVGNKAITELDILNEMKQNSLRHHWIKAEKDYPAHYFIREINEGSLI